VKASLLRLTMTGRQPTMTRLPAKETFLQAKGIPLQPEETCLQAKGISLQPEEACLQAKANVLPRYPGGGNRIIIKQLRIVGPLGQRFHARVGPSAGR
jgi:hypothetical protein